MKKIAPAFLWMTIPAAILFFAFHTFPALQGLFYSFTDWPGYGDFEFVGLKNFINVFQDDRAFSAYGFTFMFAIVSTIIVNIVSLSLALGLNSNIKLKRLLRAIYFLPNILSVVIIGFIFNFLFSQVLPDIGKSLSIEILSRNLLGNPDLAWIAVVFVSTWQAAAFNTLLYIAGLQTIPESLYEAAEIDGASKARQFWSITFPVIAPFFTINMVLAMKNFLMVFDVIMALTDGGPGRATESISLLIYRGGFEGGEFAYQSANAVIYFIIIATISIFQLKVLQKREMEI